MARFVVVIMIFALVGCGDALSTPTSPTSPTPSTSLGLQPNSSCGYSFFMSKIEVSSRAHKIEIQVVTGGGCSWVASSTDSWITVTSQVTIGTGLLAFELSPNQCTSQARTGFIGIRGSENVLEIFQDGSDLNICPKTLIQ